VGGTVNNFWSFILSALLYIIQLVLIPLFGGVGAYHQAMGLGAKMVYNSRIVFEMLFLAVGNFDLTLVGIAIVATFPMWVILVVVKIYLFIKKLIPVVG
jgi:hypothetical protein